MDREQARAEYRKILAGVVRHHQAMDRHVTGAAMARIAKRLGLRVKGGVIEAGDDEMTLVSDLAVYGRVAGSTRAIDRYARAVAGSLDTFDEDLLEALRRSWFSVFRFTSRHPIAGGSVRFQGSLLRAPPADRFPDPVLSDQESRHELPALPLVVDHRAGRANGPWLPALPLPGLRAAIQ